MENLSTSAPKKEQAVDSRAEQVITPHKFFPLPEVPKLELAENPKAEEKDVCDGEDNYDVVSNNPGRIPCSYHSEDCNNGNIEKHVDPSQPIPYGIVSRHVQPGKQRKDNSASYSEAGVGHGPLMSRFRSLTDPLHPYEIEDSLRDRRADSAAHMPLPRIPGGALKANVRGDNLTYDIIPEDTVVKQSKNAKHFSPSPKEQLYESMDEIEQKGLYETVPENITRVDSPGYLSSPNLSPGRTLERNPPPTSPIPKKVVKKKNLEKSLSSFPADEHKRRFSLFGRKKSASVSSSKQKLGSPTILRTVSPQHKSPPLPKIPTPIRPSESYEEDAFLYDRVAPVLPVNESAFQQAPHQPVALPDLPLPRRPDTCSATVVHQRVVEVGERSGAYDMVVPRSEDEPNYDVVDPREIITTTTPELEIDPPYDRVDKMEMMTRKMRAEGYDPPYDKVGQDKEAQDAASKEEESLSPQSRARPLTVDYSVIRYLSQDKEMVKEDETQLQPQLEHDEEGYAVVPEAFKRRKRAMSDAKRSHKKSRGELSPELVATGNHLIKRTEPEPDYDSLQESQPQSKLAAFSVNLNDQYALVNIQDKKDRQKRELEESLRIQEQLRGETEEHPRSPSPIPPPLPPPPRPEDLEEFQEVPPIPVHALLEGRNGELELEPSQPDSNDPPYAKVRSKVNNLYAVVSEPYTEIDIMEMQNRPSREVASFAAGQATECEVNSAGRLDVITPKMVSSAKEEVYDTITDITEEANAEAFQKEHEPILLLNAAEPNNIYDCLLPESNGMGGKIY